MTDQEFEQRLARRLHEHSNHGLRPYDAYEIAASAMQSGRAPRQMARRRSGAPAWLRSALLAGVLVLMLVAVGFAGGWIRLPTVTVLPSPTPTTSAEESPTSSLPLPSLLPTLSLPPAPSPIGSPDASPSAAPSPTGSPDASPSAEPLPSVSPTASPTPATGWREIDPFPAGRRVNLTDVAHGRAGFVIVGRGGSAGRSWFSPDGSSWTRSSDTAYPGGAHVVAMRRQFYSIASDGVWRSADGLNWTLLTASPGLEFVSDATVENGVIIAVGSDESFEQARIWTSADGITWTSISAPEGAHELINVAARGGDVVVVGESGRKVYFRGTHSSEWQEFDPFGEDQDGRLVDLASNGSGFVAVGYWDDWDSGRRGGLALSSIDGVSWTRSVVTDPDGLVFDQVTVLPGGSYLAVGSVRIYTVGECRPRACVFLYEQAASYLSGDGVSWTAGPQVYERDEPTDPAIGDMVEHPRDIAAGSDGVILIDDEWSEGPTRVFFAPPGTH